MSWNNALETRKFLAEQRVLREKYRASGMSDTQIQAMYDYDYLQFCSERRFRQHIQPTRASEPGELTDELERMIAFRTTAGPDGLESASGHSRYWWVEELENERLLCVIRQLSRDDLELLTLYLIQGFSQADIGAMFGTSKANISKKLKRIKKYFQ